MSTKVFGNKSKKINDYIVKHYKTKSHEQIGKKFGMTAKAINCRLDRLRNSGVVPKAGHPPKPKSKDLLEKEELLLRLVKEGKTSVEINEITGLNRSTVDRFLKSQSLKISKRLSGSETVYNSYSNANGLNKQEARNKMVHGVHTSGVTGTILTLPHIECTIEKMILSLTDGNDFIGCEIDETTYNGMRLTVKCDKLPIETHLGSISDKIYGVDSNTYAHLILDYCGSVVTFGKEIQYAIDNNLVKVGGTMSVTFCKRGSSNPNNFIKKLANINTNVNDTRGEMERGVEAYFHKIVGWDYEIEEIFNYQDKGKAPMMLVRIKRMR